MYITYDTIKSRTRSFKDSDENTGYTYTLASCLGTMLNVAEELFGPSHRTHTILGIDIVLDRKHPSLWYPNYSNKSDNKYVIIQLGNLAFDSPHIAMYQLSQEVVHLLCLGTYNINKTNNLEEGISSYFSDYYMRKFLNFSSYPPNQLNYKQAFDIVNKYIIDDSTDWIIELRKIEPILSKVTTEQIKEVLPNIINNDIDFLLSDFISNYEET